MKLQTPSLFGLILVGYSTASLSIDSLPEYNVSRSSYHVPVHNYTEFEYWSLNASNFTIDGIFSSSVSHSDLDDKLTDLVLSVSAIFIYKILMIT